MTNHLQNHLQNHLAITICADAEDAIAQGFDWKVVQPAVKPIEITQVVVVRNGTRTGKPTVDLVLQDDTGQRFVCMLTGALLKSIPC